MGICTSSVPRTYTRVVHDAFKDLAPLQAQHYAKACGVGGRVYSTPLTPTTHQAHGVLLKVVDADTVHVLCLTHAAVQCTAPNERVLASPDTLTMLRVRVDGIDAPEMSKATRESTVLRVWDLPERAQHRAGVRARWLAALYLGSPGIDAHPVYDTTMWQDRVWSDADAVRGRASTVARQAPRGCPMVQLTWPVRDAPGRGDPVVDAYGRAVADVRPYNTYAQEATVQHTLRQDALRVGYAKPYTPFNGAARGWSDAECGVFPFVPAPMAAGRVYLDDA